MTIRRDIEALEALGVVRRVVGGAIAVPGKDTEPSFATRMADAAQEKIHIADVVADLISRNETLILDSGSTALAVANSLKGRGLGLTVVTPSVLAALALVDEPETSVVLTGGELRSGELSLIGPTAEDTLANYNCDTYVMGIAGVDGKRGASEYHREEGNVKQAAMRSADRAASRSWVMTIVVRPAVSRSRAAVTSSSVAPSRPVVASSSRTSSRPSPHRRAAPRTRHRRPPPPRRPAGRGGPGGCRGGGRRAPRGRSWRRCGRRGRRVPRGRGRRRRPARPVPGRA